MIWKIDGDALYRLRYEAGLRQCALARTIGVWRSTLSQYETGARLHPDPDIVRRLAAALGQALGRKVAVEELLLPYEPEPQPVKASA